MSNSPSAKFFYGFVNPKDEEGERSDWADRQKFEKGALVEITIFGYDQFLRFAIAVSETLVTAEWNEAKSIGSWELRPQEEWDEWLHKFASDNNLDVSGLVPGWHLVSLYF